MRKVSGGVTEVSDSIIKILSRWFSEGVWRCHECERRCQEGVRKVSDGVRMV